jgi:Stage II sporulation protein E (SpoIIE)
VIEIGAEARAGAIAGLIRELNEVDPEGIVPALFVGLEATVGASGVRLLIADVEERLLQVCGEEGPHAVPPLASVAMDGTTHGEVYGSGRPLPATVGGHPAVLVPVTARNERIGVLEVITDEPATGGARETLVAIGLLLGHVIVAADRWTDVFHVARRRKQMTLPAELQWNLLPLGAFATPGVIVAAALEPAYEVGGDAFDHAAGGMHLMVGIFDAMGKGLTASRLSALAVAAFRNARRRGDDLEEQAAFVHARLADAFDREGYVTGQLLRIDVERPERSQIVNAGHPLPFLQRQGSPIARLRLEAGLPFGMPFDNDLRALPLPLARGDRLVLVSDGVLEARPEGGELFGEPRLVACLTELRPLPPRETARQVIAAVREHRAADLTDDATMVVVDIRPGPVAAADGAASEGPAEGRGTDRGSGPGEGSGSV